MSPPMLRHNPSISNEQREIGQSRPERSRARMIIGKQAKVRKVESWANCAAHERVLA
jgi:hypothetical protein